nr:hypothetical protein 18 [bacterium]
MIATSVSGFGQKAIKFNQATLDTVDLIDNGVDADTATTDRITLYCKSDTVWAIDDNGAIHSLFGISDHTLLSNLNSASYYHLTNAQYTDLTDGLSSSLHYHSSDRNRSNHTGTQTAASISDFDTEVSNNADVSANTSARHDAVTLAGSYNYITLSGQQITRGQIDLTTDVTGALPDGNIATSANWNAAYNDKINSASFNTGNGVLTLTQQDAGTVTVDLDGRYLTTVTPGGSNGQFQYNSSSTLAGFSDFITDGTNITVDCNMTFTDNKKALFGGGDDASIFFDGSDVRLINATLEDTYLCNEDDGSQRGAFFDYSAVKWYFNYSGLAWKTSLDSDGDFDTDGYVDAALGFRDNGTAGVDGSFTTTDSKTVIVRGGIVTNIYVTPQAASIGTDLIDKRDLLYYVCAILFIAVIVLFARLSRLEQRVRILESTAKKTISKKNS